MKRMLMMVFLVGAMCLVGAIALAYNEAPMLRAKVAAGELPPLDQRLPEEPTVLEPLEAIGQYGGELNVFHTTPRPHNDLGTECGAVLLRVSEDGSTVYGNIAKGYKLSEDGKSITLYLRKGLKWSDGMPFTADDILFTFEDMLWNEDVPDTWNRLPLYKRIEKIDDYTVRLEGDVPYYSAPLLIAPGEGIGWRFFKPKHFLKKYHIKYNSDANELAKEEGFETWSQALSYWNSWSPQKVGVPTLSPWVLTKFTPSTKIFERNPYYWKVDTAGNQLPYVDRVICHIVDTELYHLKIISGEADVAFTRTTFENYPLYKENAEAGNYRVILLDSTMCADPGLPLNLNEENPVLRKIYRDVRFRRALSLAINRDEINESLFFGLAVPRQCTALPSSSFYKEEWAQAYAQYDPDGANRLLDEMDLTKRGKQGFRIGPDGEELLLMVEYASDLVSTSLLELVKEYWEAVGVKLILKTRERSFWSERRQSSKHGIMATPVKDANEPTLWSSSIELNWSRGGSPYTSYAWEWGLWLEAEKEIKSGAKSLQDFEGDKMPGEEPPEDVKEFNRWVDKWMATPYGSKEYRELAEKIFDFHAENVFIIGTVGLTPWVWVAKNYVGNVPMKSAAHVGWTGGYNVYGEQLFIKQ